MSSEKKTHFPGFIANDERGLGFYLQLYPKCITLGKTITEPGILKLLVIDKKVCPYADKQILNKILEIIKEFFGEKIDVSWSTPDSQFDEVLSFILSGQGMYNFYLGRYSAFCSFS